MADTIREKIMANVLTTLGGISIANGYENNIALVERWRQTGNSLKSTPVFVVEEGSEDCDDTAYPLTICKLTTYITVWIKQSESESTYPGTILNSLLGDIKKALKVDITRGGNAVDTDVRSITPFETDEGQPYSGLVIEILIEYRHSQTDPTIAL